MRFAGQAPLLASVWLLFAAACNDTSSLLLTVPCFMKGVDSIFLWEETSLTSSDYKGVVGSGNHVFGQCPPQPATSASLKQAQWQLQHLLFYLSGEKLFLIDVSA